jgi:hypothetical protein
MKIKIYSSGFEHVDDYVKPFVASVLQHEPAANLTIVDNGSPEPYPSEFDGVPVVRTDNLAILTSFNKAIKGEWDWLVITDTDVICDGPFLKQIEKFSYGSIYGQQMFTDGSLRWFDSWLMCISWWAWHAIGKFNESFRLTGAFQDLDYCLRSVNCGFNLKMAELPFRHLEANTTHGSPLFWQNREYNRRLIAEYHGVELRYT